MVVTFWYFFFLWTVLCLVHLVYPIKKFKRGSQWHTVCLSLTCYKWNWPSSRLPCVWCRPSEFVIEGCVHSLKLRNVWYTCTYTFFQRSSRKPDMHNSTSTRHRYHPACPWPCLQWPAASSYTLRFQALLSYGCENYNIKCPSWKGNEYKEEFFYKLTQERLGHER